MNANGYEFTLRSSRAAYWVACLLGVTGVLGGVALTGLTWTASPFAAQTLPAWFPISGREELAVVGLLLTVLAVIALRRTLHTAHECRIGEAGILTRSLLSPEQFVPWLRFQGARLSGRLLVITHDTADGITDETWVEIPRGSGAVALRVKTYLADKQRALAARRASEVGVEAATA